MSSVAQVLCCLMYRCVHTVGQLVTMCCDHGHMASSMKHDDDGVQYVLSRTGGSPASLQGNDAIEIPMYAL